MPMLRVTSVQPSPLYSSPTIQKKCIVNCTNFLLAFIAFQYIRWCQKWDYLNTILGYAKRVEGTQHSKHLSKVYLDTTRIPNANVKVEAISQKCNGSNKRNNSKHRSQSKSKVNNGKGCHNCGTSHPPKTCPAYGKTCYACNKRDTLSHIVDQEKEARVKEDGGLTQHKDNPGMIIMKSQQTTE